MFEKTPTSPFLIDHYRKRSKSPSRTRKTPVHPFIPGKGGLSVIPPVSSPPPQHIHRPSIKWAWFCLQVAPTVYMYIYAQRPNQSITTPFIIYIGSPSCDDDETGALLLEIHTSKKGRRAITRWRKPVPRYLASYGISRAAACLQLLIDPQANADGGFSLERRSSVALTSPLPLAAFIFSLRCLSVEAERAI
jgi:hypothetical protein